MKCFKSFALFLLICLGFISCGSKDPMTEAAEKYAVEDAVRAGEAASPLQLQEQLLRARAIETRLRQNGHPQAADIYVTTFENTLKEKYPEVASGIF